MVRIKKVYGIPGVGGYYYEDASTLQRSNLGGHQKDDDRWFMPASESSGMKKVRELAEVFSVGIDTGDSLGWGDCVGVSYSGKNGRRSPLRSVEVKKIFDKILAPWLLQYEILSLRGFCKDFHIFLKGQCLDLHPGISYGISQAVLGVLAPREGMFRVIGAEWGLSDKNLEPLPLQGSSGNNRYANADKMLYRKLAALPHSQVDHIESQVGTKGEVLLAYGRWLKERIERFSEESYCPVIHLDVHGALGVITKGDIPTLGDYLMELEAEVNPFRLRIESPILAETLEKQIEVYTRLTEYLKDHRSKVAIVADEWANSKDDICRIAAAQCVSMIHLKAPNIGSLDAIVDAALGCRQFGVQVLLGGSCVETEISTRTTIHLGMVVRPEVLLVKPGMGIDEGYMLCHNEMARIQALSRP